MEICVTVKLFIALLLKFLNIVLHSVGIHLLRGLPRNERGKLQYIFIINLSATELIINVISFFRNISKLIPTIADSQLGVEITQYAYVFDYAVLKFSLQMTMILITLDRMLLIILNVKYPNYLNVNKARFTVIGVWFTSGLIFLTYVLMYLYVYNRSRYHSCVFFNRVTVAFDFLFILIAAISYGLIFGTLIKRRRQMTASKKSKRRKTFWKTFRESRFYVALVLIVTFTIFVIPPDITFAFHACGPGNADIHYVTTILYAVSYLSDGTIYIFMNDKVRRVLIWKLRRMCGRCFRNSSKADLNEQTYSLSRTAHSTSSLNMYRVCSTSKGVTLSNGKAGLSVITAT